MRNQRGALPIYLVVIILVLGLIFYFYRNQPGFFGLSKDQSLAKDIVTQKIKDLRIQTYDNLIDKTDSFSDSRLSKLPASQATSTIEPCPINICTNAEAAKKVTVQVTWVDKSNTKKVEVTTLIAKGGLK